MIMFNLLFLITISITIPLLSRAQSSGDMNACYLCNPQSSKLVPGEPAGKICSRTGRGSDGTSIEIRQIIPKKREHIKKINSLSDCIAIGGNRLGRGSFKNSGLSIPNNLQSVEEMDAEDLAYKNQEAQRSVGGGGLAEVVLDQESTTTSSTSSTTVGSLSSSSIGDGDNDDGELDLGDSEDNTDNEASTTDDPNNINNQLIGINTVTGSTYQQSRFCREIALEAYSIGFGNAAMCIRYKQVFEKDCCIPRNEQTCYLCPDVLKDGQLNTFQSSSKDKKNRGIFPATAGKMCLFQNKEPMYMPGSQVGMRPVLESERMRFWKGRINYAIGLTSNFPTIDDGDRVIAVVNSNLDLEMPYLLSLGGADTNRIPFSQEPGAQQITYTMKTLDQRNIFCTHRADPPEIPSPFLIACKRVLQAEIYVRGLASKALYNFELYQYRNKNENTYNTTYNTKMFVNRPYTGAGIVIEDNAEYYYLPPWEVKEEERQAPTQYGMVRADIMGKNILWKIFNSYHKIIIARCNVKSHLRFEFIAINPNFDTVVVSGMRLTRTLNGLSPANYVQPVRYDTNARCVANGGQGVRKDPRDATGSSLAQAFNVKNPSDLTCQFAQDYFGSLFRQGSESCQLLQKEFRDYRCGENGEIVGCCANGARVKISCQNSLSESQLAEVLGESLPEQPEEPGFGEDSTSSMWLAIGSLVAISIVSYWTYTQYSQMKQKQLVAEDHQRWFNTIGKYQMRIGEQMEIERLEKKARIHEATKEALERKLGYTRHDLELKIIRDEEEREKRKEKMIRKMERKKKKLEQEQKLRLEMGDEAYDKVIKSKKTMMILGGISGPLDKSGRDTLVGTNSDNLSGMLNVNMNNGSGRDTINNIVSDSDVSGNSSEQNSNMGSDFGDDAQYYPNTNRNTQQGRQSQFNKQQSRIKKMTPVEMFDARLQEELDNGKQRAAVKADRYKARKAYKVRRMADAFFRSYGYESGTHKKDGNRLKEKQYLEKWGRMVADELDYVSDSSEEEREILKKLEETHLNKQLQEMFALEDVQNGNRKSQGPRKSGATGQEGFVLQITRNETEGKDNEGNSKKGKQLELPYHNTNKVSSNHSDPGVLGANDSERETSDEEDIDSDDNNFEGANAKKPQSNSPPKLQKKGSHLKLVINGRESDTINQNIIDLSTISGTGSMSARGFNEKNDNQDKIFEDIYSGVSKKQGSMGRIDLYKEGKLVGGDNEKKKK